MDDDTKKAWLSKELWSEQETAWLLCGELYPSSRAPSNNEYNEASEALRRAILAKRLAVIEPIDATAGDRLYGHSRFFRPDDVITWVAGRFPNFPFDDESQSIASKHMRKAEPVETPTTTNRAHISNLLATLNQAAAKFWANADQNDRTTHEPNSTVETWLIDKGFSKTLAGKGATIIRPDWAPTGRKPKE